MRGSLILATLLRSSTILSAFGIFLISSYLFGPEGRGTIAFLTAFYTATGLILSLGLGRTIYQRISLDTSQAADLIHAAIRFTYLVSLPFLCIFFLFYIVAKYATLTYESTALDFFLFVGFFPFSIWQNISSYLFSAQKRTHIHDKIIFLTRALQLLTLLVLAPFKVSIHTFIFIFGLTGFFTYSVEIFFLTKTVPKSLQSIRESVFKIKSLLKETFWPYLDSIALSLTPIALFILGVFVSKTDLGHYNFALQMLSALCFPFGVVQVKLHEKLVNTNEEETKVIIKKHLLALIPLSIILILPLIVAPHLLPLLRLQSFTKSIPLLNYLSMTIPLIGLNAVEQGIWVGLHRPRFSSLVSLFGNSLNIAIIIIFANKFGILAGITGLYFYLVFSVSIQSLYLKYNWHSLLAEKRI